MALQLFKLVMSGTTTTNAQPTVNRYFHKASVDVSITSALPYNLAPGDFSDDTGATVTSIIPASSTNGYYMLYVNGDLVQSDLYTISSTAVSILATGNLTLTIPVSAPVTIAVTNFAPTSTTTVTG